MTMAELRDRLGTVDDVLVDDMLAKVHERMSHADARPLRAARPPTSRLPQSPWRKLAIIAAAFTIAAVPIIVLFSIYTRPTPTVAADQAGTIIATIPVSGSRAVATGDRSLWVADAEGGNVSRIDPATNAVVETVSADATNEGPWDIAVGDGAVWAVMGKGNYPDSVVRIDIATNSVTATVPVSGAALAEFAFGSVWVTTVSADAHGVVVQIDPGTNQIVATIPLDAASEAIAVGGGALWSMGNNTISRIDPGTDTASVVFTGAPKTGMGGLDYAAGALWTTSCDLSGPFVSGAHPGPGCVYRLERIDATTFTSSQTSVVTEHEDDTHTLFNINTSVVAADATSVWVTTADAPPVEDGVGFSNGRLLRFDPSTGASLGQVEIGPNYVGSGAIASGDLWGLTWGMSSHSVLLRVRAAG